MTEIVATGLTVDLDGNRIVDGVDLTIPTGSWVTLVGPNGAGKTTLLRALAGQVPFRGEVRLGDRLLRQLSRREIAREIAFVPQQPTIPHGVDVTEYVLLGRTPYIPYLGVESPEDRAIVTDILQRLDLEQFADRELTHLSGGEFQRAVIARALAQQAPVLVLDEPTSALDIGHVQQVLDLVETLRREDGLTVIGAMHDLTVAGQSADRLVMLADGHQVASGNASEVLTVDNLAAHYGARVRILTDEDGDVIVVPRQGGRSA